MADHEQIDVHDDHSSVGSQDAQNIRLLVDIGGRTIEIPLKGNLALQTQNMAPRQAPATVVADQQAEEDGAYVHQMGGWLMTVATLFVSMSFQAAMQPPAWMPTDLFRFNVERKKAKFGDRVIITKDGPTGRAAVMGRFYMLANMVTFGMGLGVLVMLLLMKKSPPTPAVKAISGMMAVLALSVALSFAIGTASNNVGVLFLIIGVLVMCVSVAMSQVPDDVFDKSS